MGLEEIRKVKEQAGMPKPKRVYKIPAKSAKKIAKEAAEKERLGGGDTDLVKFFKNAMKHMKGVCEETGLKTETRIYAYAIMSICHILPKENVKSVMYDPNIWIELNCDFHKKFDAMSWEEREQLGCWPVIRNKLILVYPNLDPSEYRFFPESVLKYMEKP